MISETDIKRAQTILSYLGEEGAIQRLIERGVEKDEAFLMVKAAKVLSEPVAL